MFKNSNRKSNKETHERTNEQTNKSVLVRLSTQKQHVFWRIGLKYRSKWLHPVVILSFINIAEQKIDDALGLVTEYFDVQLFVPNSEQCTCLLPTARRARLIRLQKFSEHHDVATVAASALESFRKNRFGGEYKCLHYIGFFRDRL